MRVLLLSAIALSAVLPSPAEPTKPRRTMAHSITSPAYERERLPNGRWKTETYALAIGQMLDPSDSDASLSALTFDEMAEILANALYREDFLPETDPEKTDLMIVVNWGKTIPFHDGLKQSSLDRMADAMNQMNDLSSDMESGGNVTTGSTAFQAELETLLAIQSLADRARRQANDYNATLLGFAPELNDLYVSNPLGGPQRMLLDELEDEIEAERYFVILQAYDFEKLVQRGEKDMLWITRFSIRAQGRRFDQELSNMARAASSLFGVESGRVRRNLLPGSGSLGEIEVFSVDEESEDATAE